MKKRVISWLLCLALCLSMLPMAALAEDVQAPEGPAPSMNEPQPEPRAKENETPAPEPEKKVQSELMTAEKLLMPLSLDESSLPFTVGKILAEQDSKDIGTDGVIGVKTILRVVVSNITLEDRGAIVKAGGLAITVDGDSDSLEQTPTFGGSGDEYYVYSVFTPTQARHSVCVTITYKGIAVTRTRELMFAKCPHPGINNNNNKCNECGAALVAELTAGASSSATYYETLEEALSAAQTEANSGCTVKLLDNCSLNTYALQKGTFTLDFNGHTLKQINSFGVGGTANLTVRNDRSTASENNGRFYLQSKTATLSLTIGSKYDYLMSYSGVGYILGPNMGYQVDGNWATLPQLYRTYIENVTVAKYRFSTSDITVSPEDAYVNREVTLSVKLNGLADGSGATCDYYVDTSASSGTTNSVRIGTFNLDANQTFTTAYTPKVSECTIRAQIKYGDFYVIKKLEKKFNTCEHDRVNQDTGYCRKCKSQMAASVSPTHYVNDRKYYETFDLAMKAALDMLKSQDCWFTMFQDAQVGTIEYQYLGDLSGKTLYMDLNEKTLTSRGVAFRVQGDKWKLDLSNGTVIGDTSNHKPVQGVIEVEAGGYLNVRDGTIQNKGANAPSIMVHGYSPSTGAEVRGVANWSSTL